LSIRGLAALALLGGALCSAGCTLPFMPVAGPESWDVREHRQNGDSLPYALVKLNPQVIDVLATNAPRLAAAFSDRRPPQTIKFGIGDIVGVTIFEAAAGGLFIPAEASVRPGNFITLPNQPVDALGNISVPYTSGIHAAGRTAVEVQQAIVDVLQNRAIQPQVVVSLIDQRTSLVSILGEVKAPARLPISAAGDRILDEIARAGGPASQGFDIWVMLERNGKRATVPFGALVYEPANNIYVRPNDVIYVYNEPQTFLVLGATGSVSAVLGGSPALGSTGQQYGFGAWRVSLAEAVAKAGGLNDSLADPASVFLYRGETRDIAQHLGVDVSTFAGPIIPVIYQVNFRDPAGYFLATRFQMRNKDVMYASNAYSVEATKFLNFVSTIVGTINDPIIAAQNAVILKNLIKPPSTTGTTVVVPSTTSATP
jgi:polysaccharide export outer membrane protein